jgi:tetratricopeptide (TPR) repeat protein
MTHRAALALMALLVVASASAARRPEPPATLGDLASRSAPIDRGQSVAARSGQAAQSYEDFLKIEESDPALRAQALRRLGDLRLAEAEERGARDGADSAEAMEAARGAIAAYQQLLKEQPQGSASEAVLYQLARAYEILGDTANARTVLDRLVEQYPNGAHFDEAQFRRAEALFGEQRYAEAERAYASVVALGPASTFYQQALYKRGWSLFKLSREDESSAAFLTLLDTVLVRDGRLRDSSELPRAEEELSADSLRVLAITFAAADGPSSLRRTVARHGPIPYEARLYQSLGDLYVEKERYQDGAEAYRAFAAERPLDPQAPLLIVRATDAYAKGGFTALVLDGKRQLVEQYGPRSAFWRSNAPNIDPLVSAAVRASLLDLARHHHALAQRGSSGDREAAVGWYRDYLDGFDDSPEAPATRLLLADLLFEGSAYEAAAIEYEHAAYDYGTVRDSPRAGYAAIVAYQKAAEAARPAERAPLQMRGVDASLRFAAAFPQNEETPTVLTRAAQVLFDAGDRTRAESVAQQVLGLGAAADADQQKVAWTIVAHTSFDAERYADAERAYTELARRLPPDDPQAREVTERLAASVYRQAEARRDAGDVDAAVREFLRVAAVAPTASAAATAEYDAAALLLASQRWGEAIPVLQRLRVQYPDSSLQPEVTRKLAVAYQETGRAREAAVEFEAVARQTGEAEDVRRAALWQAAELFVEAQDLPAAQRAYASYVRQFPNPVDAAIEARHELAELAGRAGDAQARAEWLRQLVEADAAAGPARTSRSRFLAAQASIEIARSLDDAARSVRLVVPLDRALAAKRSSMEAALQSYSRAAGYGISDITTAATFAMADLYRDLAQALLASERPPGLSKEELEQYELLLEEQAYPFEEKAIGIHEDNARRAADGVYDKWVQASYAALARMKPARYDRAELVEPYDADLPPTEAAAISLAAARSALDAGDPANAAAHAQAALALDPASASALNLLGVSQRRLGQFGEARAAFERAAGTAPGYAAPQRNLGILLDLYLGDPAAALPYYEQYQAMTGGEDPAVGPWLVELRTRLGQVSKTAEVQR